MFALGAHIIVHGGRPNPNVPALEGPKEQQVIEIEARDMAGSEIYNAIAGTMHAQLRSVVVSVI